MLAAITTVPFPFVGPGDAFQYIRMLSASPLRLAHSHKKQTKASHMAKGAILSRIGLLAVSCTISGHLNAQTNQPPLPPRTCPVSNFLTPVFSSLNGVPLAISSAQGQIASASSGEASTTRSLEFIAERRRAAAEQCPAGSNRTANGCEAPVAQQVASVSPPPQPAPGTAAGTTITTTTTTGPSARISASTRQRQTARQAPPVAPPSTPSLDSGAGSNVPTALERSRDAAWGHGWRDS